MRAYYCEFIEEGWVELIHGDSRGRAKYRFLRCTSGLADRSMWNDIRIHRIPSLDDKPFTQANLDAQNDFHFEPNEDDGEGNGIFDGPFINVCDCPICKAAEAR